MTIVVLVIAIAAVVCLIKSKPAVLAYFVRQLCVV